MIVISLCIVFANTPPISPDPATLIVCDADFARSEALVEQLGSVLYTERADATQQLRTMGRLALPSLELARQSENPEVRQRVKLILPAIRRADFQARLSTFIADKTGKYDHQLPGWDKFQTITGKNKAGRQLFIELMQSPPNRALVQAVAMNPKELGQRIRRRQSELYQLIYPRTMPGVTRPQPYHPTLADAIGMTFAETMLGDDSNRSMRGVSAMKAHDLMRRTDVRKLIEEEPYAEPTHKLILAWCDSRTTSSLLYQAMLLTDRFKWPEAPKYAVKVLESSGTSVTYTVKAASILGEYGTRTDAKHLQPFLNDETIVRRGSNSYKEIQVRDIALTMMVLMTKQKLDEFDIKTHNTSNAQFSYANFYFDSPEDRIKAFAKWNTLEPGLAIKSK